MNIGILDGHGGERGLKMPREKKAGEVEVESEGAVMSGRMTVEQRREAEVVALLNGGQTYESVVEYDPVLRHHCRLDREG